jgi:hypothetical protein
LASSPTFRGTSNLPSKADHLYEDSSSTSADPEQEDVLRELGYLGKR